VERLHESIGFEPPNPHDRAGEDDIALLDVMELFRSVDVPDEAVVRLFAVYLWWNRFYEDVALCLSTTPLASGGRILLDEVGVLQATGSENA
jgi:hypothetical protein